MNLDDWNRPGSRPFVFQGCCPGRYKERRAEDIAPAFKTLKDRAEALYLTADPLLNTNRIRINTLADVALLPTIANTRDFVEAGSLMSYGPNYPDLFRRAAQRC